MADAEIECEMDEGVARDGELWDDIGNEFRNQKRRTQCTLGIEERERRATYGNKRGDRTET